MDERVKTSKQAHVELIKAQNSLRQFLSSQPRMSNHANLFNGLGESIYHKEQGKQKEVKFLGRSGAVKSVGKEKTKVSEHLDIGR